jgi:hypothetical protein
MEQHGGDKPALISKTEVFAKAEELQLAPSDDRFDRFRKAKLLDDLALIPGTTQRGFTREQANRFITLSAVSKALGKKTRPDALAFWLVWYGFENVPAGLVCDHVERSVTSFLRYMRREFDRKRVPPKGLRNPQRWERAGEPWAKFIIKHLFQRAAGNPVAQEMLSFLVGLALRALISPTSFESVAHLLQRLAFLAGAKKSKVEALREAWTFLGEAMQLFTLDIEQNPLVDAIRKVKAEDMQLIDSLVLDTRNSVDVMGAIFPVFRTASPPLSEDPNDKTKTYIAKHFGPSMTALVALTRDMPHAIEMHRDMREGKYDAALTEFHQVKIVTDDIMMRIGVGAKP